MQTAQEGDMMPRHWQTYMALILVVVFAITGFSQMGGSAYNNPEPSLLAAVFLFAASIFMVVNAIMIEKGDD